MTGKKTGRPPHYSESQVLEGIGIVEKSGEVPTGETVKKAMCQQLKVTGGINAQSLDKEVLRLLEERERTRIARLVGALPATSMSAASEIGARITTAILEHLAEDHDRLRNAAGKKLVEMQEDLRCHRLQNRELQSKLDEKEEVLAEAEAENQEIKQRLESAFAEISALNDRISAMGREDDLRAQMLEVMREAMADRDRPAA